MLKRLLPLSFIAGLLGALAFAVPASANNYTATCDMNGQISTNPNVQLIGGTGGYLFQAVGAAGAGIVCHARDANDPTVNEVFNLNATSTGTYSNTVCGTGSANSTGNTFNLLQMLAGSSSAPGSALANNISTLQYDIVFLGGQGDLGYRPGSSIQGSTLDPATPGDTFGGDVSINPQDDATNPPPGGAGCTNHFTVSGVITGNYSGSGGSGGGTVSPPVNTSPPTISGTTTQGQTLTASPGSWTGSPSPTFTYQWEDCDSGGNNCLPATGTGQTYTLTAADVGHTIRVVVTGVGDGTGSATSAPTAVVAAAGSTGLPSDLCKGKPGDVGELLFPQDLLGVMHVAAFVWPESSTKVHLCLRVTAGPAVAGGRLDIDATGAGGLAPVFDTSQPDTTPNPPCNQQVHQSPLDHVYVGTTNQVVSVCVMVAGTTKRVDIGVTGSAAPPQITWTKDPDSAA